MSNLRRWSSLNSWVSRPRKSPLAKMCQEMLRVSLAHTWFQSRKTLVRFPWTTVSTFRRRSEFLTIKISHPYKTTPNASSLAKNFLKNALKGFMIRLAPNAKCLVRPNSVTKVVKPWNRQLQRGTLRVAHVRVEIPRTSESSTSSWQSQIRKRETRGSRSPGTTHETMPTCLIQINRHYLRRNSSKITKIIPIRELWLK